MAALAALRNYRRTSTAAIAELAKGVANTAFAIFGRLRSAAGSTGSGRCDR